jgi:ectoine hydroxylase-related dioxygenase (phytanoyl-CoA dioxygenase family)
MRWLHETDLGADPYMIRQDFIERGYVFVKRALSRRQVLETSDRLADVLVKHRWADDIALNVDLRRSWSIHSSLMTSECYRALQSIEEVHELVRSEVIRHVVRCIIESPRIHSYLVIRAYRPVIAGGPKHLAIHRDYTNWQIPRMLTVWLPLRPSPPANGSLCVRQASHRADLGMKNILDWRTAKYSPGDVLVLHSCTVHGALPNIISRVRLSVDSRWQSRCDPLPSWAMEPDGGSDWADYTNG